jgi:hypothetical protein
VIEFVPPFKAHLCWFANPDADPRCFEIVRELYEFLHRPIGDDVVLRPGLEMPLEVGRDLEHLLDALDAKPSTEPSAGVRLVIAVLDTAAYQSAANRKVIDRAKQRWATPGVEVFLPVVLDKRWLGELPAGSLELLAAISLEDNLKDAALRRWMLGSDVAVVAARSLLRQLGTNAPAKPRIFISHTKADGEQLATGLADHIRSKTRAEVWFDQTDVRRGEQLARQLELAAGDGIVLVVRTDRYSESPWCQIELLDAKRLRVPIVTVLAHAEGEPWSSAYGGNHRTMSWAAGREWEVVARCVQAWLHALHFRAYAAASLARASLPADSEILPRRPELLDLIAIGAERRLIVHPDPPLSEGEAALLRAARPAIRLATPTTLLGRVLLVRDPQPPLADTVVAFSLSTASELPRVDDKKVGSGITQEHLEDVLYSIVLATLNSGARIAYGGDFRKQDGYATKLAELLSSRRRLGTGTSSQLVCFLDRTGRPGDGEIEFQPMTVDCPQEIDELTDPARAALWHSAMREQMARASHARIVLGGKSYATVTPDDGGYFGPWSGVLEEAYRTACTGGALYIVGGFRGAAGVIAEMLQAGRVPDGWTNAAQTGPVAQLIEQVDQVRRALVAKGIAKTTLLARESGELCGMQELAQELIDRWKKLVAGDTTAWDNGLSIEENQRLFVSTDRTEITQLVFDGLRRLSRRRPADLKIALYHGDIASVPSVDGYAVTVTPGVPPVGASAALDRRMSGRLAEAVARATQPITLVASGSSELAGRYVAVASLALPPAGQPIQAPAIEEASRQIAMAGDQVGIESIACATFATTLGVAIADSAQAMIRGFRAAGTTSVRTLVFSEMDRVRYEQLRTALPAATELRAEPTRAAAASTGSVLHVDADQPQPDQPVTVRSTLFTTDDNQPVVPHSELPVDPLIWKSLRERFLTLEDSLALGRTLWMQMFSSDLRDRLTKKLDEKLVVLTDASASGLPWELLTDERGVSPARGEGLVRRIALSGTTRDTDADDNRRNATLRVLLVSDPTGNLPGARREAEAVAATLKTRPDVHVEALAGPAATIAAVRTQLTSGFFDVFHYAGHAGFDEQQPENSGLVLADGTFTAAALADVEVPRMIFLSACESGRLRRDEGKPTPSEAANFSLAEGLLRHGVSALIGTFFTVDDGSASTFASQVYATLVEGRPLGAAVRQGREALFKATLPDWGNFLLIGDDALIL